MRHIGEANVACDGQLIHLSGGFFPSHATSSAGAFAAGYPFRERKHPMPMGPVKFFNTDKGYGFIENEDGSGDSFLHITAVQAAGMQPLNKNQGISSEMQTRL